MPRITTNTELYDFLPDITVEATEAANHGKKTTHDWLWGELCRICGSEAGEVCRQGCKWEPCPGCGYPRHGGCECNFLYGQLFKEIDEMEEDNEDYFDRDVYGVSWYSD